MVVVCDGSNMKVMVISPFTNLSCQIIFLCLCSILKFSGQLMYNLPCTVKTARKKYCHYWTAVENADEFIAILKSSWLTVKADNLLHV